MNCQMKLSEHRALPCVPSGFATRCADSAESNSAGRTDLEVYVPFAKLRI
jgi:hypothetical protein